MCKCQGRHSLRWLNQDFMQEHSRLWTLWHQMTTYAGSCHCTNNKFVKCSCNSVSWQLSSTEFQLCHWIWHSLWCDHLMKLSFWPQDLQVCIIPLQMKVNFASPWAHINMNLNMPNQFMQIPGLSYINPVVPYCVVEFVIADKLQEFRDANHPSPPDYNKSYLTRRNEISSFGGYHQPKF